MWKKLQFRHQKKGEDQRRDPKEEKNHIVDEMRSGVKLGKFAYVWSHFLTGTD